MAATGSNGVFYNNVPSIVPEYASSGGCKGEPKRELSYIYI